MSKIMRLIFGLALAMVASAQISSVFTDVDRRSLDQTSLAAFTIKGSKSPSSINLTSDQCSCKATGKSDNLDWDFLHAARIARQCGCPVKDGAAKAAAKAGFSADDIDTLSLSIQAASEFGLELPNFDEVAGKLRKLLMPDGTFRSSPSESSSVKNTHKALQILEAYSSTVSSDKMSEFVEAVLPLLPSGNDDNIVDPTLFGKLVKISSSKPKVSSSRLHTITESLLSLVRSQNPETVANALESLDAVMLYKIHPVYVDLDVNTFTVGENMKSTVSVQDVFGRKMSDASVEVASLTKGVAGTMSTPSISGGTLDLTSVDMEPGRYTLELSVTVNGRSKSVSVEKSFKVVDKVSVSKVYAGVSDAKKVSLSDLSAVKSMNSFKGDQASALEGNHIQVAFTISSSSKLRPHQSFLRLTNLATGVSSYFVAKSDSKSGDEDLSYRAVVALGDEITTFDYQSGDYSLSILLGDSLMASAVEWTIGTVNIKFPPKPVVEYPLYAKSLLHTSDVTLTALPEITHVMQPPAKRASPLMSNAFTGFVGVALLGFIGYIVSLKPNLARFSFVSLLFLASLIAVLALYFGYWLALEGVSFYQTLKYLVFLLPVTLFLGRSSLASVHKIRVSEEAAKKN